MPNVHFAVPGAKQRCASRAACWSTIRPADECRRPEGVCGTDDGVVGDDGGHLLVGQLEKVEKVGVPRHGVEVGEQ